MFFIPPIYAVACHSYRLRRQPYHHVPAPTLQHIFAVVARCLSLSDRMTVHFLYRRARRGLHHVYFVVLAFLIDDDREFAFPESSDSPSLFLDSNFAPTSDRAKLPQVSITRIPCAHLCQAASEPLTLGLEISVSIYTTA
jgi:hypothetical protein